MAGKREQNKKRTRRAIMDAAMTLFVRKGFDATSIEELAQAAGIGKGTVYTYFKTKTDILYAFCEEVLDEIHEQVLRKNRDRDLALEDLLVTFFHAEFRYFTRNREFGRIYMQELVFPRPSDVASHQALDNRYFDILFPIFKRAREMGELRDDVDLLYLAAHFYGLYLMGVSAWYTGYLASEDEVFDGMKLLFRQALEGLSPLRQPNANPFGDSND